jgi:hypothetical protein
VTFAWNEVEQSSFEQLKEVIAKDVVLAFPDPNKPYSITTDASNHAIAAVLSQPDDNLKLERPIMFLSKALSDSQLKFSVTEKEIYAIVYALDRFRQYIYGRPFTIYTDHRALIWLCGKSNPNGRLGRWCNIINQYAQEIKFVQGKQNKVADALSRPPFAPEPAPDNTEHKDGINANPCLHETVKNKVYETAGISINSIELAQEMEVRTFERRSRGNLENEAYVPLLLPHLWAKEPKDGSNRVYKDSEGLWRILLTPGLDECEKEDQVGVLWVPEKYRPDVLYAFHAGPSAAHASPHKMIEAFRHLLWWKGCTSDAKQYVR